MNTNRVRRVLADAYWIIALLTLIGSIIWVIYFSAHAREDVTLAITIIASVFSFMFVIQKQAGEDILIIKDLFTGFNKRYDDLNADLNKIIGEKTKPLEDEEKNILYDYFNLCGEEYLYYKQGYVLPEVWDAWRNGMCSFFEDPRIKHLWEKEEKSLSYYGLTLKIITKNIVRKLKRS